MRTRVRGLVDKKKRATTKTMNLKHKVDHSTHATPEKGVHGTKMIRDTIYIVGSYICIRQIKLEISRAARVQGKKSKFVNSLLYLPTRVLTLFVYKQCKLFIGRKNLCD